MQRITAINHDAAEGKAKDLLDAVKTKIGFAPNMMKTMAVSPAVLEAYLAFSGALGTTLSAKLREQIALTVAEIDGCGYCAAAHSAIGKMSGLSDDQLIKARRATADDDRSRAALEFARDIVIERGRVSDKSLAAVRAAGFGDKEIAEIVANVAVNLFTNYFNEAAGTIVDFPAIEFPLGTAATA